MTTTTATIVTEDAERLVREGGVMNREGAPPDVWVRWPDGTVVMRARPTPFTVEVAREDVTSDHAANCDCWDGQEGLNCPVAVQVLVKAGEVTVTDVHHADDCEFRHTTLDPRTFTRPNQFPPGTLAPNPPITYCHPTAKPDVWHWTVEPVE